MPESQKTDTVEDFLFGKNHHNIIMDSVQFKNKFTAVLIPPTTINKIGKKDGETISAQIKSVQLPNTVLSNIQQTRGHSIHVVSTKRVLSETTVTFFETKDNYVSMFFKTWMDSLSKKDSHLLEYYSDQVSGSSLTVTYTNPFIEDKDTNPEIKLTDLTLISVTGNTYDTSLRSGIQEVTVVFTTNKIEYLSTKKEESSETMLNNLFSNVKNLIGI